MLFVQSLNESAKLLTQNLGERNGILTYDRHLEPAMAERRGHLQPDETGPDHRAVFALWALAMIACYRRESSAGRRAASLRLRSKANEAPTRSPVTARHSGAFVRCATDLAIRETDACHRIADHKLDLLRLVVFARA